MGSKIVKRKMDVLALSEMKMKRKCEALYGEVTGIVSREDTG